MRTRAMDALWKTLAAGLVSLALVGCGDDSSKVTAPDSSSLEDDENETVQILGAPDHVHHRGTRLGDNISWTAPDDPEGRLAGYNVYIYDPDPFTDELYRRVNSSVVTVARYLFTDLAGGGDYVVRVRSVDTEGTEGEWSTPSAFRAFGDDGRPEHLGQGDTDYYGEGEHHLP